MRNLKALITLFIIMGAIAVLVITQALVSEMIRPDGSEMVTDEITKLSELEQKKEEKKEEKKKIEIEYEKPQIEKVKVKASIQFTVPKIVDDDKVEEGKEVKSQEEVTKSSISIAAQDYEGDGEGGINIDDLKENQVAGGTDVPQEEEVLDNAIVEVQASYPGGEAALLKFVAENLNYPSIAIEQDLQGTVLVRFRVEKDGSVGKIVIKKSLSKECDQAAADVVSKLKRFIPAKQQGHPVPVWFTLPIRFMIN
ncbi:TonB family outer membrane receptor protein [gut metagenome]|uniref:TonB family outer membrane receptor protein n=1 Tax=gut metagenome TaxID=749906 RepID=J9H328_9ZZZZ